VNRRLQLGYLAVAFVVLVLLEVPLGVFYADLARARLVAAVEHDASMVATVYEDDLETGRPPDPRPAALYAQRTGARVVVVDRTGTSVVDTEFETERDLSTRPEIAVALTGRRAAGTRASETLATQLLYVALPVASGGVVHGAVRLTLDTAHVDGHVNRFWWGLAAIGGLVLVVTALVGRLVARSVTRPLRQLNETAARFAEGDLRVTSRLRAGPAELRDLDATMAAMADRLAELLDEQRAFVADASHQLRTPLTALRLRLENLASSADDEVGVGEIEAAIDETDRLARLVGDLLRLARADRGGDRAETDLVGLVTDRVDTWSALAGSQGVTLELVGGHSVPHVLALPGAIEQVLDNVLDNALAVSAAGDTVTVTVELGGDPAPAEVRLTVADRGPGLSDEDKARARRRFWRGSQSRPGTGLGLSIADALATACGGRLELADASPSGLAVTLVLPAVADRATTAGAARTGDARTGGHPAG
jgi:signal transduction histidine kinase